MFSHNLIITDIWLGFDRGAEGEGFSEVLFINVFRTFEVGDSAGNFDNFEVTARRKVKFFRRFKQKLFRVRFQG